MSQLESRISELTAELSRVRASASCPLPPSSRNASPAKSSGWAERQPSGELPRGYMESYAGIDPREIISALASGGPFADAKAATAALATAPSVTASAVTVVAGEGKQPSGSCAVGGQSCSEVEALNARLSSEVGMLRRQLATAALASKGIWGGCEGGKIRHILRGS